MELYLENLENQPITDEDVQQDVVYVLGKDGELHEMEVMEYAGDD